MNNYIIKVKEKKVYSSIIEDIELVEDNCSSIKTFKLTLLPDSSKYVTILKSGNGGSYIGPVGVVNNSYDYELKIEGDNSLNTSFKEIIIFIVRDKINGNIENEITLTRKHGNTFCTSNIN